MKRSKTSKQSRGTTPRIRTTCPPGWLKKIIAADREYTRNLKVKIYPDPDTGLTPEISSLGIHGLTARKVSILSLPPVTPLQAKGGKHGGPQASPQVVHQEVLKSFAGVPLVGKEGDLVIGEFNFEFLNASKAKYYAQAYEEIVKRHHLLLCVEVDHPGVSTIGAANGYGYWTSSANTRNQAVGIIAHPRLRKLAIEEWVEVGNVQGVPDLRPGFAIQFEDTVSGLKFWACVFHLKSMRGGPAATAPIRYQQCQLIAKRLQGRTNVILGGDWNCFLNNTTDTQPLTQAGCKLVYPNDSTSTQVMGGRLDGFFTYQLSVKLGAYKVRNFWKIKALGRSLSDHGLLSCRTFKLACKPGSNDPACQPGGDKDDESQSPDIVVG